MNRFLRLIAVAFALTAGCSLNPLPKNGCLNDSDCLNGFRCENQICVALEGPDLGADGHTHSLPTGTGIDLATHDRLDLSTIDLANGEDLAPALMWVSGTVQGEHPLFVDARFQSGSVCGVLLVFSGASLNGCASGNVQSSLVKPYLQIALSDSALGTYTLASGNACMTTRSMTASFDGQTTGTDDSISGTVTISEHWVDGSYGLAGLYGNFDLYFGVGTSGTAAGHLTGAFSAYTCP